jgi:hypothetical protein
METIMLSAHPFARALAAWCACSLLLAVIAAGQELPVPEEADLEKALQVVKDVFGNDFAAAKSNIQKQQLVRKMLSTVAETKDPIDRFALLQVAREIAISAGDGARAFQAVDEMARSFQIDAVRMKAAVLHDLSKKAQTMAQHRSVAEQSFRMADEAIRGDDVLTGSKLADLALAESRKARDSQLGKQIVEWKREFDEVVQVYEKAKRGLEKLETVPTDPTANLDVGKYACFVKGDWRSGLMMLALGNDPQLKELAVREIEPDLEPARRVELADAWWGLAEQTDGLGKTAMFARAAYHYRLAAPQVVGLLNVKTKRRLAQLAEGNPKAWRAAQQMARRPALTAPPARRTDPHAVAAATAVAKVAPPDDVRAVEAPKIAPPPDEVPATPAMTPNVARPREVPSGAAESPPTRKIAAMRRTVTIPANSAKGYAIGPVAAGTKITLQYVSGKWKGWGGKADICPDKTGGRGGTICLLTVVAFDSKGENPQMLTLVPQGTKTAPFSYEVKQDVPLLVLRMKGKDNRWGGNPGRVQYNLTVSPP